MPRKPTDTATDLSLRIELLNHRITCMLEHRAMTPVLALAMASAYSIRHRHRYGLRRLCDVWQLARTTLYRAIKHRHRHRGRKPAIGDGDIVAMLRRLIEDSPFKGEGYRKLWVRLRRQGVVVSPERVRRLYRDHILRATAGIGLVCPRPDMQWGTDAVSVNTKTDGIIHIFFVVDHCTAECLAVSTEREESPDAYIRLLTAALADVSRTEPRTLLRHDNHPSFKSREFLAFLKSNRLDPRGIFPLSPEGNGCAERFARTLQENVVRAEYFDGFQDLNPTVRRFKAHYNTRWLIARAKYITPSELRRRSSF